VLSARSVSAGWVPRNPVVRAVDLDVAPGEVVGLQGPSGCGKSTLARVLALLHPAEEGEVVLDGEAVRGTRHRVPRRLRTRIGVVHQSPRTSVDPRLSLRDAVAEPLRACGHDRRAVDARLADLAPAVGLTDELLQRRPHAVSDGQLQRACLARALALRPRYLVSDEMTSMLDASTTAALVAVVERYRVERGAGVLAVSHDDALLDRWAHRTVRLGSTHLPGVGPAGVEPALGRT
jgi:peptide/nickel transport system ATP-binding protein